MNNKDVIIIGAGAAGFMAAITAASRGFSVTLLDSSPKILEKVRISGGSHCNFTNLYASPENYISKNPHFCKSALAQYPSSKFIDLVESYKIPYREKKLGQLFCVNSSADIINMLIAEARRLGVCVLHPVLVKSLEASQGRGFKLKTSRGELLSRAVIVSTGGLSIPQLGASDFAYKIAQQFGLEIITPRPALVPLILEEPNVDLAGTSVDARVHCGKTSFRENVLWTHRGLSGPAILQISSYLGLAGDELVLDLCPEFSVYARLQELKSGPESRQSLRQILRSLALPEERRSELKDKINRAQIFPEKFIDLLGLQYDLSKKLAEASSEYLAKLSESINVIKVKPSASEGYAKAEVTAGGIDTRGLDSKSMMSKSVEGLYFIGECLDVTGWLGGYNLQWAWSSAYSAAMSLES